MTTLEYSAPALAPGGASGVPCRGGVGSGDSCPHWMGGGAPVLVCLQRVWRLFAVQFWQESHLSVWF